MTQNNKVPFVDLVTPHRQLEPELVAVFREVLNTAGFIGGPFLDKFESDFAKFCDVRHCVGVSSGTDALRFALAAAGVQPGDVVLSVPLTFIATTEAISQCEARPDFIDVDARTYTMDPEKLREYLERECTFDAKSGRTMHRAWKKPVTAVVPVHLYGQCADMDAILELAEKYNLTVIEDACQAHGAEYFSRKQNRWRKAGSMGRAAAFSFYPGKNLGACGEGGATTTNDDAIAAKCRMIRDHGSAKKYYHPMIGYNGRLDSLQAGILGVKLQHLAGWNQQRVECAQRYDEMLAPMSGSLATPYQPEWSKSVYHLYVISTPNRDALQKYLSDAGIGTGIHYPIPVHLQEAYSFLNYQRGQFPVSEIAAEQILSLPMYAGLTADQQRQVCSTIAEFEAALATR
jgi:dTDP-4-amino-4,6-dideoxygalactose transaminase